MTALRNTHPSSTNALAPNCADGILRTRDSRRAPEDDHGKPSGGFQLVKKERSPRKIREEIRSYRIGACRIAGVVDDRANWVRPSLDLKGVGPPRCLINRGNQRSTFRHVRGGDPSRTHVPPNAAVASPGVEIACCSRSSKSAKGPRDGSGQRGAQGRPRACVTITTTTPERHLRRSSSTSMGSLRAKRPLNARFAAGDTCARNAPPSSC
jgi:hypothetical protein